jgi:hypothetical protein
MDMIWNSTMNQVLAHPIGTKYVYSDLSFVTLAFVVGHVVREKVSKRVRRVLCACNDWCW